MKMGLSPISIMHMLNVPKNANENVLVTISAPYDEMSTAHA